MNFRNQFLKFIICFFISVKSVCASDVDGKHLLAEAEAIRNMAKSSDSDSLHNNSKETEQLNESLMNFLTRGDINSSNLTVKKILLNISIENPGDSTLSESYYFIGIYKLIIKRYDEAIRYLNLCISIKEKNDEFDKRYARAIYNLGVAYSGIGDLNKLEIYALKSLEIGKKIYGESNPELINFYLSLIIAYSDLNEFEKAINTLNIALDIANKNPSGVAPALLADLYYSLGVCYNRLADFSKAKIYLDKTESIFKSYRLDHNDNYINLLNGLAITYNALGLAEESAKYYEEGVGLALSRNSSLAYNLVNSYCILLARQKKTQKGEKLLKNALDRAKSSIDLNTINYYEVLSNYADYLRNNKLDIRKSIKCYEKCFEFLQKNNQNLYLKNAVYIGYSRALEEAGEQGKALEIIQSLLFSNGEDVRPSEYSNPPLETLKPNMTSLKILKTKYNIIWDIYKRKSDPKILEAASNTSELIVSLLDKVRINISEEDSRLILGDRYRDSYLNAIRDFNLLYIQNSDTHFLELAFEYAEKSKVAGLLASTRELKATQFHIPSETGELEKELQRKIDILSIRITDESAFEKPDGILVANLKENLLETIRKRDSLILVFEKKYPEYFAIKYNTHVSALKDIPNIVGDEGNYINYVLSDTTLYTFVANRKNHQLLAIPIDSSFYGDIKRFRRLLSMPSPSENALVKFKEYEVAGYRLYKILIDPIRTYLISDKLFISPDNILSYLPFETLLSSPDSLTSIRYKNLSYLMNSFDISYTYSATFMAESVKKEYHRKNRLIAFAPDYPEPIDIQSALRSRQAGSGLLNDLPFARHEAEYISDITGGILFENSEARESVYKSESGKYDIIHLAMHTLLNDKDPMHSTLIFSHVNDSKEDGYLQTFEIYGIPLKAKMVVLSSCNTGSGMLSSGEGILSLARGFIYSGSQSVIMSMWEIEDKSGTEIVKMFYKNLIHGYTKSGALKKARISFLENADQLRSHPYFWSTLVVYGNDEPLYYSHLLTIALIAVASIIVIIGFYFWKRRYS
jgi:CHAT domain-containing protein/tetratricopeptide (TPR) repeat protein